MSVYEPNTINKIHYRMLAKRNGFELIKKAFSLTDEELLSIINYINENNYQTIPIFNEGGKRKIKYSRTKYHIHQLKWLNESLKLAFIADKHIGYIHDKFEYIEKAYNKIAKWGADYVFDLGDFFDGPVQKSYNPSTCRLHTLEEALLEVQKYHPKEILTHFITGNHEIGFMDIDGVDIGRVIEEILPNMQFLNNLFTCIDINGLRVNLSHGSIEKKYLNYINLEREYKFLNNNSPHIISQAHGHISGATLKRDILLNQVPSLTFYGKHHHKRTGIVLLEIYDAANQYEMVHHSIHFNEEEKEETQELILRKNEN